MDEVLSLPDTLNDFGMIYFGGIRSVLTVIGRKKERKKETSWQLQIEQRTELNRGERVYSTSFFFPFSTFSSVLFSCHRDFFERNPAYSGGTVLNSVFPLTIRISWSPFLCKHWHLTYSKIESSSIKWWVRGSQPFLSLPLLLFLRNFPIPRSVSPRVLKVKTNRKWTL